MARIKRISAGPTSLHKPGEVLVAWDATANFNLVLILLESHIFEGDVRISNEAVLKSSSSNKLQFTASSTEKDSSVRVSNIICTLTEEEFSIPEKVTEDSKAPKKKVGTRRQVKIDLDNLVTVNLDSTKVHTKLKGLSKKFKPEVSSESENESEEEAENSEPEMIVEKPSKKQPAREIKKIIGAKKTKGEIADPANKKRRAASVEAERKEVEAEEGKKASKASKVSEKESKPTKGVKSKKASKPKVVKYKKNVINPAIGDDDIFDHDSYMNTQPNDPQFDCCSTCSNKELTRACATENEALFDAITASDRKISSLFTPWGHEHTLSAMHYCLVNKNKNLLGKLLAQFEKPTVKFGSDPVNVIQAYDTGHNDANAYGVALRKVAMSRGGREGNQAFIYDTLTQGRDTAAFMREE